jgi:hypothetical protein
MKKAILILLVLSSCTPVYIPNSRSSPMFCKGGEFQGSGSLGNGLEAQTALSITNHLGILANFIYLDRNTHNENSNTIDDYLKHKFFEGGIGYFENQDKMFFEIFAGYGRGQGSSKDSYFFASITDISTGKYERYFIQPAFGFNKKIMHVSFVPRFALVDFTEFSYGTVSTTIDEDPILFFEPAVIGRVNFMENRVFFTFQGGISSSINGDRYFNHRAFQISGGLGFRLGGVKYEETSK